MGRGGDTHSLMGKGVGGANSDEEADTMVRYSVYESFLSEVNCSVSNRYFMLHTPFQDFPKYLLFGGSGCRFYLSICYQNVSFLHGFIFNLINCAEIYIVLAQSGCNMWYTTCAQNFIFKGSNFWLGSGSAFRYSKNYETEHSQH